MSIINEVGARLVLMVLVLAVPLWLVWAWLKRYADRQPKCVNCRKNAVAQAGGSCGPCTQDAIARAKTRTLDAIRRLEGRG